MCPPYQLWRSLTADGQGLVGGIKQVIAFNLDLDHDAL